ncbi:MAG TPA: hypothetical protein HPP83_07000 [Candidatus Hydrogenedentes bacterium]|nr:hypothetical protein [Candidatus Hydrogenedentota bacterium]
MAVDVNEPRPLAAAARVLETRHGLPISYEDPKYISEQDMSDATLSVRKDLHLYAAGEAPKVLVPRAAQLSATYTVSTEANLPTDLLGILEGLCDAHSNSGNPGRFRVVASDGMLHIVPTSILNKSGGYETAGSVLDTIVAFPEQQRSTMETLGLLLLKISEVSGEHVTFGMIPINRLSQTQVSTGASNERARDVLIRILKGTEGTFSWRLFYDASPHLQWHVLNIHFVRTRESGGTAEAAFAPIGESLFMDPQVFADMEVQLMVNLEQYVDQEKVQRHHAEREALQAKLDSDEKMSLKAALELAQMYTFKGPLGFKKDINKAHQICESIRSIFSGNEFGVITTELNLENMRMFYSAEHLSKDATMASYLACCRRILNIPDDEFVDSTRTLATDDERERFLADVRTLKDSVRQRLMTLSVAHGYESPTTFLELGYIRAQVPNDDDIQAWVEEELRKAQMPDLADPGAY